MTEEIARALNRALFGIATDLQKALRLKAPVDTGRLRNSIKVQVGGRGLVITMVEYGKSVEFGTLPHVITPKNKQSLRFEIGKKARLEKGSGNKNIVFSKKVQHPGTRPNPFIRTTIQQKIAQIIGKRLKEEL